MSSKLQYLEKSIFLYNSTAKWVEIVYWGHVPENVNLITLHYIQAWDKKSVVVIDIIYIYHGDIGQLFSREIVFYICFQGIFGKRKGCVDDVEYKCVYRRSDFFNCKSCLWTDRERQNGFQRRPHGRMLRIVLLKV